MTDRVASWPVEALPLRDVMQTQSERLGHIVNICLTEGIDDHNYSLVRLLLPKAKNAAERVLSAAREVQRYNQRGKGRSPKWSNTSMDIASAVMSAQKLLDQVGEDLQIHHFTSARQALKVVYQITRKIERVLAEIPTSDIPAAFAEILSEVL